MSTTIIGLAVIGLVMLLVAFDAGSAPSQTRSENAIGTAWYMTPAPCAEDDPCWSCETMGNQLCGSAINYEQGYMDGYTDAKDGESYGGDR